MVYKYTAPVLNKAIKVFGESCAEELTKPTDICEHVVEGVSLIQPRPFEIKMGQCFGLQGERRQQASKGNKSFDYTPRRSWYVSSEI